MKKGIKITREEAQEIMREPTDQLQEQILVCWKAQWYDMRGMDHEERWAFISSLIGKEVTEKDSINVVV